MKYELFQQVTLTRDIPDKNLKEGDVATIVDHHPGPGSEDGYSLEVFNALGETIAIIIVPESTVKPLSANDIWHVRSRAVT